MGKDIYSFLNSNDVEAYLRQEKYEFNALQAAAVTAPGKSHLLRK